MEQSYRLQEAFPLKPVHTPPLESELLTTRPQQKEADVTQTIVNELNGSFIQTYGHTFVESMINTCKDQQITRKKTKYELKKEKRTVLRECRNKVSTQMSQSAGLFTLAEDESLAKYQRKRLSQSFEKPPCPKKSKSHTPSSENTPWNKENVLDDLNNHPPTQKINWSELARKHSVQGKNGGQIIKEFALKQGINVLKLECKTEASSTRIRSQKLKLPGTKNSYMVE